MELNFTKVGGLYVAEFAVTADFNLHIEKENGYLRVKQSTVEGGVYDFVQGIRPADADNVIDVDFTALVYPKHIRVESVVLPTMAIVSSEGDITEGVIVSTLNTAI